MKKKRIIESGKDSFYVKGKNIPKGCQLCLEGKKTVLFLNGMCQNPPHCFWYCPISEERKNKEFSFANEIQLTSKEDLLKEIKMSRSTGMSVTGGDPLFAPNLDKTLEYIDYVKQKKGKKFHVHLYTNGLNFNESIAQELANAGLDEIRFNPPRDSWNVIKYALNKGMKVGAEVPAIPTDENVKEIKDLIFYLDEIGADFININEFEYCMPNSQNLKDRGFSLVKGTIASVENSKDLALELIKEVKDRVNLMIHLCTVSTKDFWQLSKRYTRRARSIKKPFEEITNEGLLMYASIEGNQDNLKIIKNYLISNMKIPQDLLELSLTEIKFPIDVALNDTFNTFIRENSLSINILETTPFLEIIYRQITEKIPIDVFKEELEINL
ncbi:MAG: 4Fe-4S cluster-binding domain-containing protein [Promethearchaeota archaeon]|nr:MAG: 4Fe-4S cluster-binding domain-containing protein [Candidatus Lokiarchaeota archaeon]